MLDGGMSHTVTSHTVLPEFFFALAKRIEKEEREISDDLIFLLVWKLLDTNLVFLKVSFSAV